MQKRLSTSPKRNEKHPSTSPPAISTQISIETAKEANSKQPDQKNLIRLPPPPILTGKSPEYKLTANSTPYYATKYSPLLILNPFARIQVFRSAAALPPMGSQREDALGFISFSFSRLLSLQLRLFGGPRGSNQR
ncbi:USP6 N-terminal-like protein, partial [Ophiophagus hannah]